MSGMNWRGVKSNGGHSPVGPNYVGFGIYYSLSTVIIAPGINHGLIPYLANLTPKMDRHMVNLTVILKKSIWLEVFENDVWND